MGLIKSNNAKWQQWQKQQLPWGAQIRIRTLNFVALRHVRGNPLDTKLDPTHLMPLKPWNSLNNWQLIPVWLPSWCNVSWLLALWVKWTLLMIDWNKNMKQRVCVCWVTIQMVEHELIASYTMIICRGSCHTMILFPLWFMNWATIGYPSTTYCFGPTLDKCEWKFTLTHDNGSIQHCCDWQDHSRIGGCAAPDQCNGIHCNAHLGGDGKGHVATWTASTNDSSCYFGMMPATNVGIPTIWMSTMSQE